MISEATRVLLVWNAMAMMSHIRRAWSRRSSGRPLAGRGPWWRPTVFFALACVVGVVLDLAHALDALFHFAHAGEIFVELALVGWS